MKPGDGDFDDRLRELERRLAAVERVDRLNASSITVGNLRLRGGTIDVTDGDIVIRDEAGDIQMELSTDGLVLEGSLEVGGRMEWTDDSGNLRTYITGETESGDAASLVYKDEAGDSIVGFGSIMDGSAVAGHGLLVQNADGDNFLVVYSGGTVGDQVFVRDGTNAVLNASPGQDQDLDLHDTSGGTRATLGPVNRGGSPDGFGMLIQQADGTDQLFVSETKVFVQVEGQGRLSMADDVNDDLQLYDSDGNFRAILGPVTWGGSPDGHGLYIADGSGNDRFFVSENRLWVRTTDGQEGEVTAGASDSGGSGFRLLRIPN